MNETFNNENNNPPVFKPLMPEKEYLSSTPPERYQNYYKAEEKAIEIIAEQYAKKGGRRIK